MRLISWTLRSGSEQLLYFCSKYFKLRVRLHTNALNQQKPRNILQMTTDKATEVYTYLYDRGFLYYTLEKTT